MPEYCIIINDKLLFCVFDASFITFERESMCIKHRVSEIYYRCISSSVLLFANNLMTMDMGIVIYYQCMT